jgi:hypothetical protein
MYGKYTKLIITCEFKGMKAAHEGIIKAGGFMGFKILILKYWTKIF